MINQFFILRHMTLNHNQDYSHQNEKEIYDATNSYLQVSINLFCISIFIYMYTISNARSKSVSVCVRPQLQQENPESFKCALWIPQVFLTEDCDFRVFVRLAV